jgi:phenylacetate-CoA ligase
MRLERLHRGDWARLDAVQASRLRGAIESARAAPYWSDRLSAVRDVETIDDVRRAVPAVSKGDLRDVDERDRLSATPPAGTRELLTTGTTGEPFKVRYPPGGMWFLGVLRLRTTRWRRHRLLGGRVVMAPFRSAHPRAGTTSRIHRRLRREVSVNDDLDATARMLVDRRPDQISGYPHFLAELGDVLDHRYRPRFVTTHGETLSTDMRRTLTELYGVAPADGYGTAENGSVAWQCHAVDLYHVNHESVLVEIVDDEDQPVPAGVTGQVVITSLWNALTPFVRYAIGDSSAWADRPCRCGSTLPALTGIEGRTFRWVLDANGRRVAPQRLWLSMHLGVERLGTFRQYRVHQSADRSVAVEIVPTPEFQPRDAEHARRSYQALLEGLPVTVSTVPSLGADRDRKFEVVTSDALDRGSPSSEIG